MENFYCMLIIVFMVPLLIIGLGLVYIFKKDWAWQIAAWALKSVNPQRTPEWEIYATINGVIMLVGGLLFILFLVNEISGFRP